MGDCALGLVGDDSADDLARTGCQPLFVGSELPFSRCESIENTAGEAGRVGIHSRQLSHSRGEVVAVSARICDNEHMSKSADVEKKSYVDPGWPTHVAGGGHPVTELVSKVAGASSPYGDETIFPVPASQLGYVHPYTKVNK